MEVEDLTTMAAVAAMVAQEATATAMDRNLPAVEDMDAMAKCLQTLMDMEAVDASRMVLPEETEAEQMVEEVSPEIMASVSFFGQGRWCDRCNMKFFIMVRS